MQPTNYCRNVLVELQQEIDELSQLIASAIKVGFNDQKHLRESTTYITDVTETLQWIRESQKFILPPDGYILSDKTLRALSPDEIHLPFPTIALEFPNTVPKAIDPKKYAYSKTLIVLHEDETHINMRVVSWLVEPKTWTALPAIRFPKRHTFTLHEHGIIEMKNVQIKVGPSTIEEYQHEINVVLDFLNALSCRNVHMDQTITSAKKANKNKSHSKKSTKDILPFDTYRYLTIDAPRQRKTSTEEEQQLLYTPGDRYRPREHLRMGHPRKYKNGITLWINDMKINEGIGKRVEKTYIVRNSNKEDLT